MSNAASSLYEFGSYRVDVEQRTFTREGRTVPLAPKTFELLLLLVRSPGRAFSKQELMTALWPDVSVEEANLSFQISTLRKALGQDAGWIETVPKHGYRFAAGVRTVPLAVALTAHVEESRAGGAIGFAADQKGVVAATGLLVLLAVMAWVAYRQPLPGPTARAVAAVPLTAYPGFEMVPSLSPDGSQVAFTWDGPQEDNRDIYVKLVGPGEPLRLTSDPRWDMSPAWSPDGRSIAFERYGDFSSGRSEIFVIPALGGAERIVAALELRGAPSYPPRANLSWTPDGKWIAVGGRPAHETQTGIWLIGFENGERRRLTEPGDLNARDTTPSFSPDGRYLAFIRVRSGQGAIYIREMSSSLTPIGEPFRVTPKSDNTAGFAWSPDGRSLVFSSGGHVNPTRLYSVAFSASAPRADPEILPFGEQARAVTISKTGRLVYSAQWRDAALWKLDLSAPSEARGPVAPSTYDEHTPDFSPDGKRLAFASTRSGSEEIWIADADGSHPRQMTAMKGPQCSNPRWSPDGKTILFSSRREGSQDLYLLSPDTAGVQRITDDPGEEFEARWSRDGRTIYFGSRRSGQDQVWRMGAGGGPAVQITQHGGMTATESTDGRLLYYAKGTGIWQVPVGGGEEKPVVDGVTATLNFVVATRGLYFLAVANDATGKRASQDFDGQRQPTSIDFYEFATGKRTTLFGVGKQAWAGMALSPDERSLLYSVVDSAGANLMLVDKWH
jgi:Tol biopolymer transport system component/DNA-binding winged helix-turn-helix (wHTH) protein